MRFDSLRSSTHNSTFTMTEYTQIINGKPVTSPTTLDVLNPGTQQKIAEAPVATKEQLDEAVAAARAAFPEWSAKPVDERAEILIKIADVIEKNAEDYKKSITLEQGKPLSSSQFETDFSAYWLRETSKLRITDAVLVDDEKQKVIERYVPIGVCAGIVPWNVPLIICVIKLAAAVLTGNTIILKPSPFTPLTTLRFIKDIQHLVPPGVVNVLSGDDGLGPMITSHPGIDKISFTGSSFTGQKVVQSASVGLKRVTLELGGNDPAIILPDVDPKVVAPQIFWGTFAISGQGCILAKRIYVHEKIYDEFRDALVEYSKTIKVGNGMEPDSQLGPIQNLPQYKKVLSYFEDAHANNYKFALGGDVNPNPTNGLYVPISIVDNPPEDSKIVREEPFGPIVPLLKWNDEKDVIKRANDTNQGLAASVWGKDLDTLERIALQIQAGTVSMNQFIPFLPSSAFAGHKQSGLGAEGGITGLKAYTNVQIITLNKAPTLTAA
ncbi:aldehyde dehydrogenase family protein [Ceratobasidium sp. AG-I]|nr:aldehyde dehydrogenase family protein [Ceratobasidium sp. AG-I]